MFTSREVQGSPEFERILALPRRQWTPEHTAAAQAALTARLKTFSGTMSLLPDQARALWDAQQTGGLVGPLVVGAGKTLLSFLLFVVLNAKRGILLLPGGLIAKTEDEFQSLAKHWHLHPRPTIISYERLGLATSDKFLDGGDGSVGYRPDVIVADEAHYLKSRRAARTRRVERYMKAHPETKFVALSGTLISSSLLDMTHLVTWALKSGAPVPRTVHECTEWASALDEGTDPLSRMGVGELRRLTVPGDTGTALEVARRGFRSRFLDTPGVVASYGSSVGCSIRISPVEYTMPPEIDDHYRRLRETWTLPDGWTLTQAVQAWQHAREFALGLHNMWDPRPPEKWLRARSAWASYVREVLSESRSLDSELMVRDAVKDGRLPGGRVHLDAWEAIAPTFTIQPRPEWHGDYALRVCEAWMKKAPGIVWTEHTFFALELSRRTGLPYYGPGGLDSRGNRIEGEDGKRPIIASVRANSTGRNLQYAFARNLLTAPTSSAKTIEQLIGRTHRTGQKADEVIVDMLCACREHFDAVLRARARARMILDSQGSPQKLLLADLVWPREVDSRIERPHPGAPPSSGWRWVGNQDLGALDED